MKLQAAGYDLCRLSFRTKNTRPFFGRVLFSPVLSLPVEIHIIGALALIGRIDVHILYICAVWRISRQQRLGQIMLLPFIGHILGSPLRSHIRTVDRMLTPERFADHGNIRSIRDEKRVNDLPVIRRIDRLK